MTDKPETTPGYTEAWVRDNAALAAAIINGLIEEKGMVLKELERLQEDKEAYMHMAERNEQR